MMMVMVMMMMMMMLATKMTVVDSWHTKQNITL